MFEFSKIKLVIWDLDETFWKGTISEEKVEIIIENAKLIKTLTDCGIVNSICSKNDLEIVKKELINADLWKYFVFPSVNWQPKGVRVKQIISDMNLRPANVLFIDDNSLNLNEAKHFCPELMTIGVEELSSLYNQAETAEKKDLSHKRLKQYEVLQEKVETRENFSDNEEFLRSCNIKVNIKTDCIENVNRLHELVLRSNQLNYTKVRPSIEEFTEMLTDSSVKCGYTDVSDKFGEYGIVGFYAVKDNKLVHFVFSCRTLGMGIEQYIYAKLGYPNLEIVGNVASELPKKGTPGPDWINSNSASVKEDAKSLSGDILFKGPCDLMQIFSFIQNTDNVKYEFTYNAENGNQVVGHNHTSSIITALTASAERKNEIISEIPNWSKSFFDTTLTEKPYSVVCLSMFLEVPASVYSRKKTGEQVAVCWENTNRKEILNNFDKLDNSDAGITMENLKKIRSLLPESTMIILLLPSDKEYKKDDKKTYLLNKNMNELITKWAEGQPNVELVDFSEFIKSQDDYTDSIFHYSKRVYYDVAQALIKLLSKSGQTQMKPKGKKYFILRNIYSKIPLGLRTKLNKAFLFKALSNQEHKED